MKPLTIGDPQQFAIESCITQAYARLSFRALGYFLIHVGGFNYGVQSKDATMLACSFEEVGRRISRRGSHTAPFSNEPDAALIASAVYDAIYSAGDKAEAPFGVSWPRLREIINTQRIQWAPDGDEAFDDGSRVLQFDVDRRVRIIAYKLETDSDGRHRPHPQTLRDHWMDADEFYGVLQKWRDDFETEWLAAPKVSEKNGIREVD
jgi:hypothetical protein